MSLPLECHYVYLRVNLPCKVLDKVPKKPENRNFAWLTPGHFESLGTCLIINICRRNEIQPKTCSLGGNILPRGLRSPMAFPSLALEVPCSHWQSIATLHGRGTSVILQQGSNWQLFKADLNGGGGSGLANMETAKLSDWFICLWGRRPPPGLRCWPWEQVWFGGKRLIILPCKRCWSLTPLGSRQCWSLITSHLCFHLSHWELVPPQGSA